MNYPGDQRRSEIGHRSAEGHKYGILADIFKNLVFTGTGLAQPKLNKNRQMAPRRSIWLRGFQVEPSCLFCGRVTQRNGPLCRGHYSWNGDGKEAGQVSGIIHSAISKGIMGHSY